MPRNSTKILDSKRIGQKVNRMAFQIFEDNFDEKEILMVGIDGNGYKLAERLAEAVRRISPIKVTLIRLKIDKENPIRYEITLPFEEAYLKGKVVILVDDVLNSGRTLIYGVRRFLRQPIKKLRTAILVNRSHRRFPIDADFVGMSLATTLREHVEVSLVAGKEKVTLQ